MSQAAWVAVSTAFFTAGLLLIVLLERLRPYDKGQAFLRRGFWTDLIGYADAHNHNFATKLALWDRLFGTAWLPVARKPDGYGLGYDGFPEGYLRQQIFAFRAMRH